MALDPLAVLRLSVKQVPALKYALGVAGLLAVVAMSKVFSLDPSLAVAGTVVTLLLMTSLVVFAKLSTTASRHFLLPVQVLMWAAMVLLVATGAMLFISAFFHWPIRFRSPEAEPIPRDAVSSDAPAPAAAAENVFATQSLVQSQLDAGDYATAWKTAKQASDTQPASPELLALSAKVAEAWIRNAQISDGETFAGLVDPLLPVLYRMGDGSDATQAADALAHVGWASFLKYREGIRGLQIDQLYRRALEKDAGNPFAHVMWGHWLLSNGDNVEAARTHFMAAVASGRERPAVRRMQLAALQWDHEDDRVADLIRVCNNMRKGNEPLPGAQEDHARLASYLYEQKRAAVLAQIDQLPAAEQLATFHWLTSTLQKPGSSSRFVLARLTEASGDCDAALRQYTSLLALGRSMITEVQAGIERTIARCATSGSHQQVLVEFLADGDAAVRAGALAGLADLTQQRGVAARDLVALALPLLRDTDEEVRRSASSALTRLGRAGVPGLVEQLAAKEGGNSGAAAHVLAQLRASDVAPAVPALVRALQGGDYDERMRDDLLDALANAGPAASSAVAPLLHLLDSKPGDHGLALKVIYVLGAIGPASTPAVPALTAALLDRGDASGFVNVNAATALGAIGPGAASSVPSLIEALGWDDERLSTRAAEALGSIGAPSKAALEPLVDAVRHAPAESVNRYAEAIGRIAQALARKHDRTAIPVLRDALQVAENQRVEPAVLAPLRSALHDLSGTN